MSARPRPLMVCTLRAWWMSAEERPIWSRVSCEALNTWARAPTVTAGSWSGSCTMRWTFPRPCCRAITAANPILRADWAFNMCLSRASCCLGRTSRELLSFPIFLDSFDGTTIGSMDGGSRKSSMDSCMGYFCFVNVGQAFMLTALSACSDTAREDTCVGSMHRRGVSSSVP